MNPGDFSQQGGPVEPSAALRAAAKALRELYLALTAEGFSERQSLAIIGESIKTAGQQ